MTFFVPYIVERSITTLIPSFGNVKKLRHEGVKLGGVGLDESVRSGIEEEIFAGNEEPANDGGEQRDGAPDSTCTAAVLRPSFTAEGWKEEVAALLRRLSTSDLGAPKERGKAHNNEEAIHSWLQLFLLDVSELRSWPVMLLCKQIWRSLPPFLVLAGWGISEENESYHQ